jgi:hypothetical protein
MGKPSKAVLDFMDRYKIASDEIWEVHGSTWVVKHKALERVAAEQGISFGPPTVEECNTKEGIIAMWVPGALGERKEWAFGEASPKNNKNSYPWAMAEKRAKDRVILKLLNGHGALYSEAEAEEFAGRDENGKPARLAKKDAKEVYAKLQQEMQSCSSREILKEWGKNNKERINILPEDWEDTLRIQFEELMLDIKQREAA